MALHGPAFSITTEYDQPSRVLLVLQAHEIVPVWALSRTCNTSYEVAMANDVTSFYSHDMYIYIYT